MQAQSSVLHGVHAEAWCSPEWVTALLLQLLAETEALVKAVLEVNLENTEVKI